MRKLQVELRRKEALYADLKRPNPSTYASTRTTTTAGKANDTSDKASDSYTSPKGQDYDSSSSNSNNNRADEVEEELKKLKLMMKK